MASIDWSDIFGPPSVQSTSSLSLHQNIGARSRKHPLSARLQELRNRLIRDEAVTRIENHAVYPLPRAITEAQIISRNAEAMLRAVETILQEKVAKRIEEEGQVYWPWPENRLIRMKPAIPPRPSAASRKGFKKAVGKGENARERAPSLLDVQSNAATAPAPAPSASYKVSETLPLHNSGHKQIQTSSEHDPSISPSSLYAKANATRIQKSTPQPTKPQNDNERTPTSPAQSSSSKYSRSTGDDQPRRSQHSHPASTAEDPVIAWPWPQSVVQAATARSSSSSVAAIRRVSARTRSSASSSEKKR